jgi:hypothetical protein
VNSGAPEGSAIPTQLNVLTTKNWYSNPAIIGHHSQHNKICKNYIRGMCQESQTVILKPEIYNKNSEFPPKKR